MIIAIDGPAASGKGTLARKLADHFGHAHLDTGSLYRTVALALSRNGESADDRAAAVRAAGELDVSLLDDPALWSEEVGEAASVVAENAEVRIEILEFQRRFATERGDVVLDGRDIGTVVCPEADVKLFVTAGPEVRARRRFEELKSRGETATFEDVLANLRIRDARDEGRTAAPLKPADDALLLDTSELDIDTAFQEAVALIRGRMESK